jgi:O-antigen/teichoic acid export membrane protein
MRDSTNKPRPKTATFRLVGFTLLTQVAIQAIAFVCGLVVVRTLSLEQYAIFTLANVMLGTMSVLADGGVAAGTMSEGGKVWREKIPLGSVLKTAFAIRKKFAACCLVFAIPILLGLLHHHGASWKASACVTLCLTPVFLITLSNTIFEIAPKLHQDIALLQQVRVGANLIRLLVTIGFLLVAPFAIVAIIASGAGQLYANLRLRFLSSRYFEKDAPISEEVEMEISRVVHRIFPGALYYSFSTQITYFLLSIFGTTTSIAQLGALGRISVVLVLLNSIFATIVVPRYARLDDNSALLSKFLRVNLLLIAAVGVAVTVANFWAYEILWVLGPSYANLEQEVTLVMLSSGLSLCSSSAYSLSTARAIVPPPVRFYGTMIVIQSLAIIALDFSTVKGAILFSIVTFSSSYALRFAYFIYSRKGHYQNES